MVASRSGATAAGGSKGGSAPSQATGAECGVEQGRDAPMNGSFVVYFMNHIGTQMRACRKEASFFMMSAFDPLQTLGIGLAFPDV
jgi:hypothetical protein